MLLREALLRLWGVAVTERVGARAKSLALTLIMSVLTHNPPVHKSTPPGCLGLAETRRAEVMLGAGTRRLHRQALTLTSGQRERQTLPRSLGRSHGEALQARGRSRLTRSITGLRRRTRATACSSMMADKGLQRERVQDVRLGVAHEVLSCKRPGDVMHGHASKAEPESRAGVGRSLG